MKEWNGYKIFTIFVVTILVSSAITVGLFTTDAFAESGTKKLFITGKLGGLTIPLYSCTVTTDVNSNPVVHFAKGSGVIHAYLEPVNEVSPTKALTVICKVQSGALSGSIPNPITLVAQNQGPTYLIVQLATVPGEEEV